MSITIDSNWIYFPLYFFIWAAVHSLLATLAVKSFVENVLGRGYHFYRISYVIFSAVSLAAVFVLAPRPIGIVYEIGGAFFYILKGIQTVALIAFLFAGAELAQTDFLGLQDLKKYFSPRLDGSRATPLITDGLLKYSRHPVYFFAMLLLWSDPHMTASWAVMSFSFSVYFVIGSVFEERKLVAAYGEKYKIYRKNVRRFIPIKKFNLGYSK